MGANGRGKGKQGDPVILGSKSFPWRSVEALAEEWELPFLLWLPRKHWWSGRVLFPRPAHAWVKPVSSGQLSFEMGVVNGKGGK